MTERKKLREKGKKYYKDGRNTPENMSSMEERNLQCSKKWMGLRLKLAMVNMNKATRPDEIVIEMLLSLGRKQNYGNNK